MNAFRRCLLRRVVTVMLACLVPLQGMAAAFIIALGPAHTHALPSNSHLVLDDVRRTPVASWMRVDGATTAISHSHFHGHGGVAHHHHAANDPTVVLSGDAPQPIVDGDGSVVSPSLAAFVAVLDEGPVWLPDGPKSARAHHLAWAVHSHVPEPPERPPRAG